MYIPAISRKRRFGTSDLYFSECQKLLYEDNRTLPRISIRLQLFTWSGEVYACTQSVQIVRCITSSFFSFRTALRRSSARKLRFFCICVFGSLTSFCSSVVSYRPDVQLGFVQTAASSVTLARSGRSTIEWLHFGRNTSWSESARFVTSTFLNVKTLSVWVIVYRNDCFLVAGIWSLKRRLGGMDDK